MLAACLACCMAGCRDSDTFKEIVYDQTSETVDTENPDKIYINDTSSDETSDSLPSVENDKDAPITEERQSLVVYGSSPNTNNIETKQSLYDSDPQFNGIESSGTVSFYYSEDEDVSDHEVAHDTDNPEDSDDIEYTTGGEASQNEPMTGSNGNDDNSKEDGNGNSGDTKKPNESDDGGSDDGDFDSVYDASDPNQKPPKVDKLAAFGNYAPIVAMIGGKGALVATDSATLKSRFSNVFDCSGMVKGWDDNGKIDVSAIIKSGADAVLLRSQPSASDAKKLKNAKVNVTLIGDLTTSQEIKSVVKTVGEMLSESNSIQYKGKTQSRASDYVAFHDRVVKEASSANGGLAQAGDCGQLQKSSAQDKANKSFASGTPKYTALVVEYDKSARYSGPTYGTWRISDLGMAFGRCGINTSPVSYYIQAGGMVDNTAYVTKSEKNGGLAPLWQFYTVPFKKSEWSGSLISSVSSSVGTLYGSNHILPLMTNVNANATFKNLGDSFGTDTFPKLIAKSASIKQGIISNSAQLNSTLHPYGRDSTGIISHMGPNDSVYSCIGYSEEFEDVNPLGSSIQEDRIDVQPAGLFCDWTEGTVESFLESAWVNDVVKENSNQVNWKQEVQDFYQLFYGYALTQSDLNTIIAGAE